MNIPLPLPAALAQLDPKNDEHWTADGQPVLAVLSDWTGDKITRAGVKEIAPDLSRENAPEPKSFMAEPVETPVNEEPVIEAPTVDDAFEAAAAEADAMFDSLTDEEILEMTPQQMGADMELLDRWIAAASKKQNDLHREMEAKKDEITVWARRADIVDRVRAAVKRASPKENLNPTQAYLKAQQQARMEKVERAQAFIASGTTAQEVVKQLQTKAPIDAALGQRKAAPGSTRPARDLPVKR